MSRRFRIVVSVAVGCLASVRGAIAQERTERFVVDEAEVDVPVLSIAGDDAPRPDDVLRIGELLLTRGEAASPRFRIVSGDVHEIASDGTSRLVAVRARSSAAPAPLAALPGLRGVETPTCSWSPSVRSAIDFGRCVVSLADSTTEALETVPDATQLLALAGGNRALDGLTSLARMQGLRFLRIEAPDGWVDAVSAAPLGQLPGLSCLIAPGRTWEDLPAISGAGALRVLDLSGGRPFTDLGFASSLRLLRRVDVDHTWVDDLTPLLGLPDLRGLDASYTSVRGLPSATLPLLRLDVSYSPLAPERLAGFRKANPQCEVIAASSRADLLATLDGVDGVRVRTGGICHRAPDKERVLWSSATKQDVTLVLALLGVEDPPRGYRCMCCGDTTFEFLRGADVVQSVSVQHGTALRAAKETWPSDVGLPRDAALRLCAWLSERGAPGPGEALARRIADERAAELLPAREDALLPGDLAARLRGVLDGFRMPTTSADELLVAAVPVRMDRLLILFRLKSIDGERSRDGVIEALERTSLAETARDEILDALRRAPADDETTRGAARWLVESAGAPNLVGEAFDQLVEPAARKLLAGEDADAACAAVRGLERSRPRCAPRLLREALAVWSADVPPDRPPTPVERAVASALVDVGGREDVPRIRAVVRASGDGRWAGAVETSLAKRFLDLPPTPDGR